MANKFTKAIITIMSDPNSVGRANKLNTIMVANGYTLNPLLKATIIAQARTYQKGVSWWALDTPTRIVAGKKLMDLRDTYLAFLATLTLKELEELSWINKTPTYGVKSW